MKFLSLAFVASSLLPAACSKAGNSAIDVRPMERGLEFLGMSGVLAALILVFGKHLSSPVERWSTAYGTPLMFGLFVILVLSVAMVAAPYLILPLVTFLAVLAAGAAIAWWIR